MGGARLLILAALFFHHLLCCWAATVRICAFNIQRFGEAKAAKSTIMNTLVKILLQYDICLLQEVQDAKGQAIPRLVKELNRFHGSELFIYISSGPLGRSSYLEKYVFIYRSDKAKVVDSYRYEDNHPASVDVFAREPYIVRFHLPTTAIKDLVLVPQHTTPSDAVKEIDALYDVFLDVQKRWNAQNLIFLGDFNADCDYVAKKRWPLIRLRKEPGFHWLIEDDADTTVKKNTNCAYDRIVVYGEQCYQAVIPGSARVFDFLNKFGLLEAEALEISDHYPVEVELSSSSVHFHQNWLFILMALVSAFALGCFELAMQH
ncbi:deoxyribonuclease-1-like 1 [Microcaecilia unicolor]|uniref:Deoxyribonuclease n=1 Tax=Microcaecilia unicolor TaxID=1415580 RepID=A0A6P7X339_9AMPH|nr:deoxyribonuclease-1-like 1 [Microcaecilia unicolor]XP_030049992.1 deoxyribonuclease-1-like 1 [Microcaecilia unicolor]XP_030049993.1 deoxyribonuclease-1-like 1 [Microcaecilia unicolor]XP_030049994.1 deoxyribonuclease-1-like 1 [Microcaecilia unicolor]XP_030049995.1 deoxyribonuclease-1-like 1 [Microcaecilia unicolor]XP_030049996.1 deoxyribonuclease-1-like 1 [Microcaecilia unicolor]XP_030049997.1 deoxyribonuclease-1-like 1 [Microcaecilia unicolor]XP_030049998.1 deoxyribonuclease-1-like 1 [Mic